MLDISWADSLGKLSYARRLVEAAVSVAALRFVPDGRGAGVMPHWEDHAVHGNIFEIMKRRGPKFDQAVSALIEDLGNCGLDKQVLVILAGEFGRTPRITYSNGNLGRDHWVAPWFTAAACTWAKSLVPRIDMGSTPLIDR